MEVVFSGRLWWWRGPSPFHFLTVPPDDCEQIDSVARAVTYGWGMVPVSATIGATTWATSLCPTDAGYVLGVKAGVRRAEGVALDDEVAVRLVLDL